VERTQDRFGDRPEPLNAGTGTSFEPAATGPSAVVPDWTRERVAFGAWQPAARLLRAIRAYQTWQRRGRWAKPIRHLCVLRVRFWNVVCGSEIHCNTRFGGGLMLPHPTGVVIHPAAKIGVNCMIFQGVTIGAAGPDNRVPTIGGHVDIGAGAKVLGGVTIGDHAKIGANAVVLCNVPAGATAVGIPARILPGPAERSRPSRRDPILRDRPDRFLVHS
jgi:serine O-acetyltransferase